MVDNDKSIQAKQRESFLDVEFEQTFSDRKVSFVSHLKPHIASHQVFLKPQCLQVYKWLIGRPYFYALPMPYSDFSFFTSQIQTTVLK